MNTYRLYKSLDGEIHNVMKNNRDSIPFNPDNTEYQTFKKEINEGTAQLEDADGNLMTEQEAKEIGRAHV